jgi:hypothetical protein
MLGNMPLQILERRIKDGYKFDVATEFSIRVDEPVHPQVAEWAAGKAIKGEHVSSTSKRTSIKSTSVNVR